MCSFFNFEFTPLYVHYLGNDELDETVGEKAYKYLKNNREGIRNLYKLEPSKVKTYTEGQVSHVLSDRLSRKPCAWMDEGLETISQLRIFQLNGGKLTPDNMKRLSLIHISEPTR